MNVCQDDSDHKYNQNFDCMPFFAPRPVLEHKAYGNQAIYCQQNQAP